MNGIELAVSSTVSLIAVCLFLLNDSIDWLKGRFVLLGTLLGGDVAASISMKVPQKSIGMLVIAMSMFITCYFPMSLTSE